VKSPRRTDHRLLRRTPSRWASDVGLPGGSVAGCPASFAS